MFAAPTETLLNGVQTLRTWRPAGIRRRGNGADPVFDLTCSYSFSCPESRPQINAYAALYLLNKLIYLFLIYGAFTVVEGWPFC